MKRSDMLAHVGSMQQAAYVRPIEYQEGRTHGLKAVEVKNGPLRFMSMADKALDVALFEYKGENLTFLSKPGLNGRNRKRCAPSWEVCSSPAVSRTSVARTLRRKARDIRQATTRCMAVFAPRQPNM